MPRILHNTSTDIILQLRIQQPGPEALVIALWPLPDLVGCDGELGTAAYTDDGRNGDAREEDSKGGAVIRFCCWG